MWGILGKFGETPNSSRSSPDSNCKAQTFFWLSDPRRSDYSKLIKEDHFACKPQGCLSNRSHQVHLVRRSHILAAFRLFTCQRALFSSLRAHKSLFHHHLQAWWRRFLAGLARSGEADNSVASIAVNTCREILDRDLNRRSFNPAKRLSTGKTDRKDHRRRLTLVLLIATGGGHMKLRLKAPQRCPTEGR